MKIHKVEERVTLHEVVEKIICNKCERQLPVEFDSCTITIDCGYGSIYDGMLARLELCDPCLKAFIDSLKHAPKQL